MGSHSGAMLSNMSDTMSLNHFFCVEVSLKRRLCETHTVLQPTLQAKEHSVVARSGAPLSTLAHMDEIRILRIQEHADGLPGLHVYALEAKEALQRHPIFTRAWSFQKAQHHIVGVHLASVCDVHTVLHCRALDWCPHVWHCRCTPAGELAVQICERDSFRSSSNAILEGGVAQPEAKWHDSIAGVEAICATRVGA